MYVRVCAFHGFQLQSKNPQWRPSLHLYRLTIAAADARGRCASVSSPTGHLGVNRWKPGQPIQKNRLPDCHRSLCVPRLERRQNAKIVLNISHLQSFLPPPTAPCPVYPLTLRAQRRRAESLARGNTEIVYWKKGEGPQNESYRGGILTIPLTMETLLPLSSAYLYAWPEPQDYFYVLGLCSHPAKARGCGAVYCLEQVFR